MLEFLTMMSVIAIIFCAATVFVALLAGVVLRITQKIRRVRTA